MKKRVLAFFLCMLMALYCMTGCGNSEKENSSAQSESDTETVKEESSDGEEGQKEDQKEELNSYGLTESQQEKLLADVKSSLENNYLKPQNISAAEFSVKPYDPLEQNNYDASGNYTGDDPYEWASVWRTMDDAVASGNDIFMALTAMDTDPKMAEEYMEQVGYADTLDEQWKTVMGGDVTASSTYELANAVYMGIAEFLNSLDTAEKLQVISNLQNAREESGEAEGVTAATMGANYNSTMFDRVIAENIQFS